MFENWVGWLIVLYVPSTARSFRDGENWEDINNELLIFVVI